jgi:hypothetical protein
MASIKLDPFINEKNSENSKNTAKNAAINAEIFGIFCK